MQKNVLLILDVPVLFKVGLDEFCNHIMFFSAQKEERIDPGVRNMVNFSTNDKRIETTSQNEHSSQRPKISQRFSE